VAQERLRLASLHDALAAPGAMSAGPPTTPAAAGPPALPVVRTPSPWPAHRASQAQLSALPGYLRRLFGGDPASAKLKASLADHRPVTVAGPGGMGKTLLADENLSDGEHTLLAAAAEQ
jgi:hypothetical protein